MLKVRELALAALANAPWFRELLQTLALIRAIPRNVCSSGLLALSRRCG
jgi:hypothetical protein